MMILWTTFFIESVNSNSSNTLKFIALAIRHFSSTRSTLPLVRVWFETSNYFLDSGGFVSHAPNSVVAVQNKRPLPSLPYQPEPAKRTIGLPESQGQVRQSQSSLASNPQNDLTQNSR
jgi:hypothetical protein